MTGDVCLRRRDETDAQFIKREFNHCMSQVGRCHDLQFERQRMGWLGAAIFYQFEAARWYKRAMDCRTRYDATIAAIIPGTAVRWDEIGTRKPRCSITWDEINSLIPPLFHMDYRNYRILPEPTIPRPRSSHCQRSNWLECTNCHYKDQEDEFNPGREGTWDCPKCGHEAKATVYNIVITDRKPADLREQMARMGTTPYQTPAQKFNDPRDRAIKRLTEQMQDVIDGIDKRKK